MSEEFEPTMPVYNREEVIAFIEEEIERTEEDIEQYEEENTTIIEQGKKDRKEFLTFWNGYTTMMKYIQIESMKNLLDYNRQLVAVYQDLTQWSMLNRKVEI